MKTLSGLNINRAFGLACLGLLVIAALPTVALAAGPTLSINTCAPGLPAWSLTIKIVTCIQNSVIAAVITMMTALQNFMLPIIGSLFVLAFAVFGIRVVSGEKPGRSAMYLIRMFLVAYFFFMLPTFAGWVFAIETQLITLVSGGYSPWTQIDNLLGNLIGFGPTLVLFQGLLGIIAAALTSSSVGVMVFMAGFSAVGSLLKFVFNVVYTYLASIIMLGFLIVLSPIFIPFAVFFVTERYIKKLTDMIISVMLMPALLFAFIKLFMTIFDVLIADIFNILPGGRNFRAIWNINNPVFSWVMPSDRSLMERLHGVAQMDPNMQHDVFPPVQTNVNPFLRHGFNAGGMGFAGLNFGPNQPAWMQELILRIIALWLFAMVMKTMVSKIPEISSSIAGSVIAIPLSASSPMQIIENVGNNLKIGFGAAMGGGIGGELGGRAAQAAGGNQRDQTLARQTGGILGAMAGMMVTTRRNPS